MPSPTLLNHDQPNPQDAVAPLPRVLCVGDMVADIFADVVPALPKPGELCLTDRIVIFPGGNALNTAVALRRLGENVILWGSVGSDPLGELILSQLTTLGLDLRAVQREPARHTPATIILRVDGEDRRFIHALGASDQFTGQPVPWDLIPTQGIVVAAGFLKLRSWRHDALVELFQETRRRKSLSVLNVCLPNHAHDMAAECLAVLPYVDVFVLNDDEARLLTGQRHIRAQARTLCSAGAVTVIITRGAQGLYAHTSTGVLEMGAFPVALVDPSGCGDCFTAGLVFGLLRQWDWARTLRFASAVGALNATALGCTSGVPAFPEVDRFVRERSSELFLRASPPEEELPHSTPRVL